MIYMQTFKLLSMTNILVCNKVARGKYFQSLFHIQVSNTNIIIKCQDDAKKRNGSFSSYYTLHKIRKAYALAGCIRYSEPISNVIC